MELQTELEGKNTYFGQMRDGIKNLGYCLGGGWEYHKGSFDSVLWREGGETIYLRIPFLVLEGELDEHEAYIKFQRPFVIKHVVNIGLDNDESSLISATGFGQFQDPIDTDGQIKNKSKWKEVGLEAVNKILPFVV